MRLTSIFATLLILGGLAFAQQSLPTSGPFAGTGQQPVQVTIPTQGVVTLDQLMKRLEDLQKRLGQAQQVAAQAEANVHAIEGAIADEQQWIDGLKAQAEKTPPKGGQH